MNDHDHNLFTKLFVENEHAVYGFVFSLLPNRADADDVVQETMTQLWEHFGGYDQSRPFLPWANRFAYRQVLMHRRRQGVRRKFFSEAALEVLASEYPEQPDWGDSRKQALQKCLGKLSDEQLTLIRQRYSDGDSLVDLAEQLDRTVNSLYKSLQRIRKALADCVTGRMAEEGCT